MSSMDSLYLDKPNLCHPSITTQRNFNILTGNIRKNWTEKIVDVIDFISKNNIHIAVIQEANIKPKEKDQFNKENNPFAIFTPVQYKKSESQIAILMDRKFLHQSKIKFYNDRLVKVEIFKSIHKLKTNPKSPEIIIIGIHAPFKEKNILFFHNMHKHFKQLVKNSKNVIITGDANETLNPLVDRRYSGSSEQTETNQGLKWLSNKWDIIDLWREQNPDSIKWTREGKVRNGYSWSRIDSFWTSVNL